MFEIPELTKENIIDVYYQIKEKNNQDEINAFISKILAIEDNKEFEILFEEVVSRAHMDLAKRISEFETKGKYYGIQLKILSLNPTGDEILEKTEIFNRLLNTNFEEIEENRFKCFEFLVTQDPHYFYERLKKNQPIGYPNKELLKIYIKNKRYDLILYGTLAKFFSKEDFGSIENNNDELTIIFANITSKIFRGTDTEILEEEIKELFTHIDKFGNINFEKYIKNISNQIYDYIVFNEIKNNFIYFENMGVTGYKFFESIMKYCSEDSVYVIRNLNSDFISDEEKEKLKELIFNKINVRLILIKDKELEFNDLNELVRMMIKAKATNRFFENLDLFINFPIEPKLNLVQTIKDISDSEGSLKILKYLQGNKELFIKFATTIPFPEDEKELAEFEEYIEKTKINRFKLKEILKHISLYSDLCKK